jgi:predicted RNA binding protein YcfA (HicA-like mRNA interferase family)
MSHVIGVETPTALETHHPVKPGTVTVSGKPSKDLPIFIEINIFRQAGITRRR